MYTLAILVLINTVKSFMWSAEKCCLVQDGSMKMKTCSPIVSEMLWPAADAHALKEKLWKMVVNHLLVNTVLNLK